MVVASTTSEAFRQAIHEVALFENKFDGITVAPQKTEDGPLVKELQAWLKGSSGTG